MPCVASWVSKIATHRRHQEVFRAGVAALIALCFAPPLAAAPSGADAELQPDAANETKGLDPDYWRHGDTRWFVSARAECGALYAKPYVSAGYGKPHWLWTGVDVNAIATIDFIQGYAGFRASTPIVDLAFGWRDTSSYGKGWLNPASSYDRADVLTGPGPKARYWAWEAEAVVLVPLPHSALIGDLIAVKTLDVPRGKYLYDESYRVIVKDSVFEVLRTGLVARLLRADALKVGVLSEWVFGTGRSQDVLRLGPVASWQLTDHLEAVGVATFSVHSPDRLGLDLGTYALAGVRYRWATGERNPRPPWR
jgi:hypothetical protein